MVVPGTSFKVMARARATQFRHILRKQFPPNARLPLRIGIAVSGGVDSMALCHLASVLGQQKDWDFFGTKWYAFIIDHGMREGSLDEANAVASMLSERLHNFIPRVVSIQWPEAGKEGERAELDARIQRYRHLAHLCNKWQCEHLLLGHHMDDLAETILMRIIRDSGHKGLAGMGEVTNIPECEDIPGASSIKIHRPLLGYRKAQLTALVEESDLTPFEDHTNFIPTFTMRNAVRSLFNADPSPLPPALQVESLCTLAEKIKQQNETSKELVNAYIRLKCRIWPVREAAGTMVVKFPSDAYKESEHLLVRVLENIAARIMPQKHTERRTLNMVVNRLFRENIEYLKNNEQREDPDDYDGFPATEESYYSDRKYHRKSIDRSSSPNSSARRPSRNNEYKSHHSISPSTQHFSTLSSPSQYLADTLQFSPRDQKPKPSRHSKPPKPPSATAIRKTPEPFTACGLFWQPFSGRWLLSRTTIPRQHFHRLVIRLEPRYSSASRTWVLFDSRMWILPPTILPPYIPKSSLQSDAPRGLDQPTAEYPEVLAAINKHTKHSFFADNPDLLPISHYEIRPLQKEDLAAFGKYMGGIAYKRLKDELAEIAPGIIRFTMPVVVAVLDTDLMKKKGGEESIPSSARSVRYDKEEQPMFMTELEKQDAQRFDGGNSASGSSDDEFCDNGGNDGGSSVEFLREKTGRIEIPICMPTLPPVLKLNPEIMRGKWYFKYRREREEVLKGEFGSGDGRDANALDVD